MSVRFLILAAIVALNGFFASAEVALVSVRRSRLKELASQGRAPARAALELLANPERLLSLTQVGVTLASLGLGWAGEQTAVSSVPFDVRPAGSRRSLRIYVHGASFALGFLAISFFHVVVGEVVPKNLAIEKADGLALLVAPASAAVLPHLRALRVRGGALRARRFRALWARAAMPEAGTPPKS